MLSPRTQQVFDFIRDFIDREGHGPLLSEIADTLGIRSKGVVHRYLQTLEDEGLIERLPGRHRGIRLAGHLPTPHNDGHPTLPLLGRIAAGRPIEAIAHQEEFDVAGLIVAPNRYALAVKGESMIEAGIYDGDWAVIRACNTARNGEIVVALVDREEATLKYFQRNPDGTVTLIPANPAMAPMIYSADRVQIQGVLVSLVRTY
jgi:repressor LexA